MEKLRKIVAQRLKKLMENRNLIQKQFADKSGLSKDTVSKVLNENMALSVPNAIRISRAFGVSLDYLYGQSEYENADRHALEILLKHFKFSKGTIFFPLPVTEAYLSVSPVLAQFLDSYAKLEKAGIEDDLRKEGERRAKEKFLNAILEETEEAEDFVLVNKIYYTDEAANAVRKAIESSPPSPI